MYIIRTEPTEEVLLLFALSKQKKKWKKNKPQIKRLLNSFYIFCVSTLFQLEYITLYNIHIEKATNFETYKQSLKSTNTTIQKWESYRNR